MMTDLTEQLESLIAAEKRHWEMINNGDPEYSDCEHARTSSDLHELLWSNKDELLALARDREQTHYLRGYALACSNVVGLHDEPTIASDALMQAFGSREEVMAAFHNDPTEYDADNLSEIFKARSTYWMPIPSAPQEEGE